LLQLRLSVLALGLSILIPLACGATERNSGSDTNWSVCSDDDDCSNVYSCLCGVCTSACEFDAADCRAAGAQCTELAATGCALRDGHESACLPSCTEDEDCDSIGDNLACEANVCIADTVLDEPPDPGDLNLPDLEPQSGTGRIALGVDSPCVTRAGKVWCWGSNGAGQAAQPPGEQDMPIVEIAGLEGVVDVFASAQHKCALTEAGRVYCWGLNDRGQVGPESAPAMTCSAFVPDGGPGNIPCQPTPTLVPDLPAVASLTLNDTTTCAWFEDGDFTCWGETSYLQSAEGALSDGVSWLALGPEILCAVSSTSSDLWCTGDEAPALDSLREVTLSPEFDGGPTFGCALDVGGDVDCWGRDDSGQRGLSSFGSPELNADDEPAIREDAVEVQVGQNHACALLVDGTVACWGRNDHGETGAPPDVTPRCDGMPCQPSPTPVVGVRFPLVDLASRGGMTCALSEDAELYCWGGSDYGSPWRIPGPWEGSANECDGIDQAIAKEILDVRHTQYTRCETERDCVEVDLGVSCYQGCQSAPMHKNDAEAMSVELARVDDSYCPAAEQLDCGFARPNCPPRRGELACVEGACVRFDYGATNCEDACACKVLQELAYDPPGTEQECYALKLQRFVPCVTCDGSGVYFAVSNTGQAAFVGEVVVELWSEPGAALREPVTFELSLEPGEHSEPLYIESGGVSGLGFARLVAADSCDFMSEWTDTPFDMPASATCSE